VQAATVVFYLAVAFALRIPISPWDLAVIVPLSFVIQMAPVSINGFGVREATFTLYFARLGLPIESALLVSLVPTALVMLFSLSGAAVYVGRRH
jgi:glycosyltransferase 2 family protein